MMAGAATSRRLPELIGYDLTAISKQRDRDTLESFRVTAQIGHVLRRASQRHTTIFSNKMVRDLTPTRFAALCMLFERGSLSQNELGRLTAMDVATVKGVVDRLSARGLVSVGADPADPRRNLIELTRLGRDLIEEAIPVGLDITSETLKPLKASERKLLLELLGKIT